MSMDELTAKYEKAKTAFAKEKERLNSWKEANPDKPSRHYPHLKHFEKMRHLRDKTYAQCVAHARQGSESLVTTTEMLKQVKEALPKLKIDFSELRRVRFRLRMRSQNRNYSKTSGNAYSLYTRSQVNQVIDYLREEELNNTRETELELMKRRKAEHARLRRNDNLVEMGSKCK